MRLPKPINLVARRIRKILRPEQEEITQLRKSGFLYLKPQNHSTVTQARARIPSQNQRNKVEITPESFWRDLSDINQYLPTTWRPFLEDKNSRSKTLKKLFIALKGGPSPDNENQRSVVGIDSVIDADACYNLDIIEEGIFPKLTHHYLDNLGKKVTALIMGLGRKEAGLGYLVSPIEFSDGERRESDESVEQTKSHIRAVDFIDDIEKEYAIESANVLYLQMVYYFAIHLLNADSEIQNRKQRADELRDQGINRDKMLVMIDRFIEMMATYPPLMIVWRGRGADCSYLTPMDYFTKARILANPSTPLDRPSMLKNLSNNLKDLKKYLKDQFKRVRKKNKTFSTKEPLWKFIVTRVARNFRDFHSLYEPEEFINKVLKPVLEKLFMQDENGKPGDILTDQNRQKVEEMLQKIRVRAERNKSYMQSRYPTIAKDWQQMKGFYTNCKTELDLARQKAADVSLEREKKYPEMSDQEKIRFRERMEEKLVSPVKKKYPLTVKPLSPFPFPFDAKTLSDDEYSKKFSEDRMEELKPTSITKPTPFVRLLTFFILPANLPRNRNEDLASLMYRLGISVKSSPFDYD